MFKKLDYACNPYLPGKDHVPDGEPHIFGDRLYVFGSHDEIGSQRYCTGSYIGWSAPINNLKDWRCEGVILEKGQDPMDPDKIKDYYAPDVVQGFDGRYYLYYSIEGSMGISVAVSEKPAGTYKFYGHVKDNKGHVIGSSEGDIYQFDPALLKDDDGKIYLYSGQGIPISEINGRKVSGAVVCELEEDMLTTRDMQKVITSNDVNCFTENPFFEASSIRKIGGKYYFIYSPLPNTHFLCYAISDYPNKNFEYKGVLISNADIFLDDEKRQHAMNYWGNNHGSIIEIDGDVYVFYHRNTNKTSYARQGCVERLEMDKEGNIKQAELSSKGFHKGDFIAKKEYAAYIACHLTRKDMLPFVPFQFLKYDDRDPYITEEKGTDISYIADMQDGAKAGYKYLSFDGTEREVFVKVRGKGNGIIVVSTDNGILTNIPLTPKDKWTIFKAKCRTRKESSAVYLTYQGSGAIDLLSFGMS